MSELSWRARINAVNGPPLGAGLLVADNRILTCAHVVTGHSKVAVSFPGVADDLSATVAWRGPWRQPNDHGDLALVELDDQPSADGCELAALDALRPVPGQLSYELRAMGFPYGHERDGIHATLRSSTDRGLSEEWLQVEVENVHLQSLNKGFSGAAVWMPDSGQVVGMITDAVLDDEGKNYIGRMLPLDTIRRYWEELDDYLPHTWLPRLQRGELRAALHGITATRSFAEIFSEAFPTFLRPVPEFTSAWAAIRFLGESLPGDDRLHRFLSVLERYLSLAGRARVTRWRDHRLPTSALAAPGSAPVPTASVVVMVRTPTRGGGTQVLLTVNTFINGFWGPATRALKVDRGELRSKVERALTSQLGRVSGLSWMIEFAVPWRDLGLNFDEWELHEPGTGRHRFLRSVPLVVWPIVRLQPSGFTADRSRERWRTLRARGKVEFAPVSCELTYGFEEFSAWLEGDDQLCALACASHPGEECLEAAWFNGVPVMVWSRRDPAERDGAFCGEIAAHFSATDPDRLPAEVMGLRKAAWSPAGGGPDHCARNLTLYWDDPARMPDPPLGYGRG